MFKTLLIILLLFIFFQDLKSRAVYWFLFPVLMALSFVSVWKTLTTEWLYNLLFLALMMASLTIYVSLKEQKLVNITRGFFSWGDILFLLAITPLFPFHTYLLFFTAGTILALLIHLGAMQIRKQETIPYAGYMALVLIPCIVWENQIFGYFTITA